MLVTVTAAGSIMKLNWETSLTACMGSISFVGGPLNVRLHDHTKSCHNSYVLTAVKHPYNIVVVVQYGKLGVT